MPLHMPENGWWCLWCLCFFGHLNKCAQHDQFSGPVWCPTFVNPIAISMFLKVYEELIGNMLLFMIWGLVACATPCSQTILFTSLCLQGDFWIYLSEIRQEAMVFTIRILCTVNCLIIQFLDSCIVEVCWSECSPRQFKGLDCRALAFHCQWQQDIGDAMHLFVEFITCHT